MPVTSFLRPAALGALLALAALPAKSDVNAGAYLAGRSAATDYDFSATAQYFGRAMMRDPGNPLLMDYALAAHVSLGDIATAVPVARQMMLHGTQSQTAHMVLLAETAKNGDWAQVIEDLDAGQSVGPLFDGLLRAWALVGLGERAQAMETFDTVRDTEGVRAFGLYHKALALAALGDHEAAAEVMADDDLRLTRRGLIAHAQILSQLGRHGEGVALLRDVFGSDVDGALEDLMTALGSGQTQEFDIAPDAGAGVAEVFFTIANALGGEGNLGYTLLYARLAEYLRPGHIEALLLVASLMEQLEQYDLAIESYGRVPHDHPASDAARLGRADALRRAGRTDAAIEAMEQLAAARPDMPLIHVSLGDILRDQGRFDEARRAYDRAVDLFETPTEGQWRVYFARAITFERTDRWEEAEADFRTALDLNPDQPQVLNYLGYSYVERQENLDEALDMIQRAVAAQPDSGYITDSLGWVFYRLGRFEEAVAPMERAVELMPIDPVINDHLGDVYWAVGRRLEARFQWKRALSFIDPDDTDGEADPDRIRRKLDVGLDIVLEEEGAPPLRVANDG